MRIYRSDYGMNEYQYINGTPKKSKSKLGCGSCGGSGGLQGFLDDVWTVISNPKDLAYGYSNCPPGQIPTGWFSCAPITTRTVKNGEVVIQPWKGTEGPSPISNAWDYYGEEVKKKLPTAPKIDWMTVGIVALVGILIIKKL